MYFQNLFKNEKNENIYFDSVINPNATKAVIFLHGIAGSRRYWSKEYKTLSRKYSLYFIDLLGFGLSAKPNTNYTLEKHITALHIFIQKEVKEKSIVLVGHSLGATITLAYAHTYPKRVEEAFLLSLPYFHSEKDAKEHLKNTTSPSYFVIDTLLTRITCSFICYFGGPISRRIMHFFIRKYPKEVVSDGFLHTYNSYISTLYNVVYKQNIPNLLSQNTSKKITLIHGDQDKTVSIQNIQELAEKYNLKLITLPNQEHTFPIQADREVIKLLQ